MALSMDLYGTQYGLEHSRRTIGRNSVRLAGSCVDRAVHAMVRSHVLTKLHWHGSCVRRTHPTHGHCVSGVFFWNPRANGRRSLSVLSQVRKIVHVGNILFFLAIVTTHSPYNRLITCT